MRRNLRVIFALLILLSTAIMTMGGCSLLLLLLPDFADWPVDTEGYTIEVLPEHIVVSFTRGNDVYLGLGNGKLFKADDCDLGKPWIPLGQCYNTAPMMLFVSKSGTILASFKGQATCRSSDGGQTWEKCLDESSWRMDEDDLGHFYVGNYIKDDEHVATLYKSTDDGLTWQDVFREESNHHIHTVRWDDQAKRLYIAFGDGPTRGQAFSDDRGQTFTMLAQAPDQGHTDVAFTANYIIWASDDQSGRVFRVDRQTGLTETLMGRSQFMWFAVANDQNIYIGTYTSRKTGGERAALLASHDEGTTWQKLLETDVSTGAYDQGFYAESRNLSAGGWLYCSADGVSYRIRRNPDETAGDRSPANP